MLQLHSALTKKFQEPIVLVPFFGAEKQNLNRHIDFLNGLGYDCVSFELKDDWKQIPKNLVSTRLQFGLKHVWSEQVEKVLNETSGRKIVFSFSNPSASAIEAIGRRAAQDITGLICDGGPSGEFWQSMIYFFTHEVPLRTYPIKMAAATLTSWLWNLHFERSLHEDLEKFPQGFRVLSIRGWKDKLISPQMIDKVFEPHPQLDWQKLSLPMADHLTGLKDFPNDYKPPVVQFLKEISTPI